MPGIRGVAFDLEGTVIDVEFAHFEAFRLAAEEVGLYFDPNNLVADIASKIPNAIGGGNTVNSTGIWRLSGQKSTVEEISRRKLFFYNQIIEGLATIAPRPGFLKVFQQILKLGLSVAIASLTPPNQAKVLFERSGVHNLFPTDCILLENSVTKVKPDPEVYLVAADRMGIHPSQQLVFEDSPTGLMAARAAGSPAVAMPIYTFPANIEALKKAGPVEIFTSWTEIDNATLTALLNI